MKTSVLHFMNKADPVSKYVSRALENSGITVKTVQTLSELHEFAIGFRYTTLLVSRFLLELYGLPASPRLWSTFSIPCLTVYCQDTLSDPSVKHYFSGDNTDENTGVHSYPIHTPTNLSHIGTIIREACLTGIPDTCADALKLHRKLHILYAMLRSAGKTGITAPNLINGIWESPAEKGMDSHRKHLQCYISRLRKQLSVLDILQGTRNPIIYKNSRYFLTEIS